MIRPYLLSLIVVFSPVVTRADVNSEVFFQYLNRLEFNSARDIAVKESDKVVSREMITLIEVLYNEDRCDRSLLLEHQPTTPTGPDATVMRLLSAGYASLFLEQVKGKAFRQFHSAYKRAMDTGRDNMTKACLLAILKYYDLEIAHNSESYVPYLEHYSRLSNGIQEHTWLTLYKLIFYSKSLNGVPEAYHAESRRLDDLETKLGHASPLIPFVYYEHALKHEIDGDDRAAADYYQKTVQTAGIFPYLRYHRFFSYLKLMRIGIRQKDLRAAEAFFQQAAGQSSHADTLRSNYHLNFYGAVLYHAMGRDDTAFVLLNKAYTEDFKLDFRKNTLSINRLAVELQTQEKENSNFRLRENRNWLITALVGAGLLALLSYLAYANQKAKTRVQIKEKEVAAMKVDTILKEQELVSINAMIEGQERERQRTANEMHDNLGSLLATLKLHFQTLRTKHPTVGEDESNIVGKAEDILEEAYQKVRSMAHARFAGVDAKEGLLPAVRQFASRVSVINRFNITVNAYGLTGRLENTLEITLFRVVQELVTNVIKHSRATEATISLTQFPDKLNIMVEDNGVGFDKDVLRQNNGMGLYSIQKRIEAIGGTVTIDPVPNSGTTIILDIPLT